MRRLIGTAVAATAAALAATAGAATFRPAADGLSFTPLTRAQVQQAPTCQFGRLCYTPQMIRDAYDFPKGQGGASGEGQTIVVVDAYGSPFLDADLAGFEQQFGLQPADLTVVPQQTVVAPPPPGDEDTLLNWALETSLDVEWAHALAPGAKIVLAVAANSDPDNFVQVEQEVLARYPTAIVSQSFGTDETGYWALSDATMSAFDTLYAQHVTRGGTVVTSSGDAGATNGTPFGPGPVTPMASYPASSPFVLSVGGTEGSPYPGGLWQHGRYGGEQVWNESFGPDPADNGASGGAPSTIYPAPPWQLGLTGTGMRAEPDVAYDAANDGGVIIAFGGRFGVLGGTSVGAPSWAAIVALANELRGTRGMPPLGLATPQLYTLARDRNSYRQDFHDIVDGANDLGNGQFGLPGFSAGTGYDYPTGLGTPDVARLVKDLAGRDALRLRLGDLVPSRGRGQGGAHGVFEPGR
jgi:subtilase family serine protease